MPDRIIRTRCSALPLLWKCPASAFSDGGVIVESTEDAAEAGTAVHRYAAKFIADHAELDAASLAAEHGVDAEEVGLLCALWRRQWAGIEPLLGEPGGGERYVEKPVQFSVDVGDATLVVTGSADLIGVVPEKRAIVVVDWKSGRIDTDYTHQQRGYGAGVMETFAEAIEAHDIIEIVCITVWLREGVWDVDRRSLSELSEWKDALTTRVRNSLAAHEMKFNAGGHCNYCPRCATCPGRRAMVEATVADLCERGEKVVPWTPETRLAHGEQIGEMYRRAKLLESATANFRQMLNDDLREHGELPIGGGRSLRLLETNRRKVDAAKARPVLMELVSEADIDRATTISVSQIEKAIARDAPRGMGKSRKEAMTEALEEAGALQIDTSLRLHEGRATPECPPGTTAPPAEAPGTPALPETELNDG